MDNLNEKVSNEEQGQPSLLGAVSGSAIRSPLGLKPNKYHDERVKVERFNEVCGAIARYYNAGKKINIEWIEEYNELVECVGGAVICSVCKCEKDKDKDCDYCIRQYALSWGL